MEQSLSQILQELRAAGYRGDFAADGRGLRCGACGTVHDPAAARIDRLERFEGQSDPDDESILVALTCSHCSTRGVFVAAFGPTAGPDEADVLARLTDARP